MVDIDVGAISEALNYKLDLDFKNLQNGEDSTAVMEAIDTKTTESLDIINTASSTGLNDINNAAEALTNYQQPIEIINTASGSVSLEHTKIYRMSITGDTTFVLPTVTNADYFHQIKIILQVTGTPTITWGTDIFFNKATPEIEEGYYDVYFDYDSNLSSWVCGVMPKGAANL